MAAGTTVTVIRRTIVLEGRGVPPGEEAAVKRIGQIKTLAEAYLGCDCMSESRRLDADTVIEIKVIGCAHWDALFDAIATAVGDDALAAQPAPADDGGER